MRLKRCGSTRQSWQDVARREFWGWVELVATVRSSLMSVDASENLQGTSSTPSQPGTTLDTPLLEIATRQVLPLHEGRPEREQRALSSKRRRPKGSWADRIMVRRERSSSQGDFTFGCVACTARGKNGWLCQFIPPPRKGVVDCTSPSRAAPALPARARTSKLLSVERDAVLVHWAEPAVTASALPWLRPTRSGRLLLVSVEWHWILEDALMLWEAYSM